jgi:RNA polymerase sigma factor (TIGR02999 family)
MSGDLATHCGETTQLLVNLSQGDRSAWGDLYSLVYSELKRVARNQLRRERPDHTLYPTALVHEAYLKMVDETRLEAQDRAHFLGLAARAMRQILIDHARARGAVKRGGDLERTSLTRNEGAGEMCLEEMLALDAALDRLGSLDERMRQVVELTYFGGMTEPEVAQALGVSDRTVRRDWVRARAWLYKELYVQ